MIKTCYVDLDINLLDKKSLLEYVSKECYKANLLNSEEDFLTALLKREEEISTAVGKKVAIPHAIGDSIKNTFIYLIRLKTGIDFNALDGEKVRLFFVIGTATKDKEKHLKVLSKIANLLLDDDKKFNFFNCRDSLRLKNELEKIFLKTILIRECNFVFQEKIMEKFKDDFNLVFKTAKEKLTMFDFHENDYVISFNENDKREEVLVVKDYKELDNALQKIKEGEYEKQHQETV